MIRKFGIFIILISMLTGCKTSEPPDLLILLPEGYTVIETSDSTKKARRMIVVPRKATDDKGMFTTELTLTVGGEVVGVTMFSEWGDK